MATKTHSRKIKRITVTCFILLSCFASSVHADNIQKQNCVLCGHITDAQTGRPVINAVVSLNRFYSAPTDIDGFYYFDKFPDGNNFRIAVDSNDYVGIYDYNSMPVVKLVKDKSLIKNFKLDKACIVELRIVDEANNPVKDAKISAVLNNEEKNKQIGSDYIIRCSDPNGYFVFGGFPPSQTSYIITAIKSGKPKIFNESTVPHYQSQYDYAPGILKIDLNDINIIESAQIILKKGADVNGVLLYQDGVPASDLKICAYPELWSHINSSESFPVDANGNFTLRHIIPGIYQLMAYIPHSKTSQTGCPIAKLQLPPTDNKLLSLKIPQKSPKTLVSIQGKFIFTGEVPNFVDIKAYSSKDALYTTVWQNNINDVCDYNFIIDRLEPDIYKLTFSSGGFEQKIIENIEAPAKDLEIELKSYGQLNLIGIVINALTGQPIQKYKARARRFRSYTDYSSEQPDNLQEFENTDGKFSINAVSPGIYRVQVIAEGFTWTWSEDIDTQQNNIVIIKLSAGGGIKGKVLNQAGKPINGAKVMAFSKAAGYFQLPYSRSTIASFFSDEGAVETSDGIFEMKNLIAGFETIKVTHPDYAYSTLGDIEIRNGQTTEVQVIMNPGGIVEGYVYDSKNKPSANSTLYFQSSRSSNKSGCFAEVTTDSKGHYRAGGLPEEIILVERPQNYEDLGVINRLIVPSLGKTFRLDFGGKPTLSGKIVVNEKPVANQKITLGGNDYPSSNIYQCISMTGDDGEFSFNGVPRGTWTIYYQNEDNRSNWVKLLKINTNGQDQDIGLISESLASIYLSLQYPPGITNWNILQLHLEEKDNVSGQITAVFTKTSDNFEEYVAKKISPGEYSITLYQQSFTMHLPITTNGSDIKLTLQLPVCNAGIYGIITGKTSYGQMLWRQDKMISFRIFPPGENGKYRIDNLPAGRYSIGNDITQDEKVLVNFELAYGEQKEINFEIPDMPQKPQGYLSVLALDENGTVLSDAVLTIENNSSIIEPFYNSGFTTFFAAPGIYSLHITCKNYKEINQSVNIVSREETMMRQQQNLLFLRLEKQ